MLCFFLERHEHTVNRGIYSGVKTLRKRRRRLWLALRVALGGFAIVVGGGIVAHRHGPGLIALSAAALGVALFVAGVVLFAVTWYVTAFSRCPRCGQLFHLYLFWFRVFSKKCVHCGLPLRAGFEAGDAEKHLIRCWLSRHEPRGPIPDVGLRCPKCGYVLTGLTEQRCPECGSEFDVDRLVDES